MFFKSFLKASSSSLWFMADSVRTFLATSLAFLQPYMITYGWIFYWTSFSASLKSSPARTATVVVPSPTSSSCVFEISIKILAAGLSTKMDYKIVAPSFVTVILFLACWSPNDCKILSMPFGPRVVLTKSATAIAPTKDCYINKN